MGLRCPSKFKWVGCAPLHGAPAGGCEPPCLEDGSWGASLMEANVEAILKLRVQSEVMQIIRFFKADTPYSSQSIFMSKVHSF